MLGAVRRLVDTDHSILVLPSDNKAGVAEPRLGAAVDHCLALAVSARCSDDLDKLRVGRLSPSNFRAAVSNLGRHGEETWRRRVVLEGKREVRHISGVVRTQSSYERGCIV